MEVTVEVTVRHILVSDEASCSTLKEQIASGELTFEKAAEDNSTCPSSSYGGALGKFGPGRMVAEFDKVMFNDEVGVVHGPVKTQFGYHLIEMTERS